MKSLVTTGFAVALFAAGCSHQSPPAAPETLPSAPVRVQTVAQRQTDAAEEVVGTVRAKLRARIEAKVSGRIEKMAVQQGQSVKAGELLAQLDVREIQARLEQAAAQRDQAARDLKRFETLLTEQAVTQQEYDGMQARHRVAQAAMVEAETQLSHARIEAPFDGLVVRKLADVGDLAMPGKPLLEMEDPAVFRLETDVPEGLMDRVQMGAKLGVRIPAAPAVREGVVSEINPAADPNSRTFQVKLDLAPSPGLRAGLFGRVAIPLGTTATLRVPAPALVRRGQMEMVFVITNQHAQLRLVKTGKHLGEEIEVVSGLAEGEPVAVAGAAQLRDGQPVEITQ